MEFAADNLHWYWFSAGMALIALEAFLPGAVVVWFGFAALLTGVVSLTTSWGLNGQMIFFSLTALSSTAVFKVWQSRRPADDADDPATRLNQGGQELIGRQLMLVTPLKDGSGRVKVADSSWRCTGPDLPEGTEVRVIAVRAGTLIVEAAQP